MVTGQNFITPLKTNKIPENIHSRLSVQISLTGLSFLVINLETKESLFFSEKNIGSGATPEELLQEIDFIIAENEILQSKFDEVVVIYSNNVCTTVPVSLFDETKASEYLKFNSKILSNDFIAHDILESYDVVVIYIPYVNINNYFFERFGSFQYYHAVSILLKEVLSVGKHTIGPRMFLHVQKEQLDAIVLVDGNLQLCNSFLFKTSEDFIYYVLFCLEQLKLNPDTIPMVLCGAIDTNDSNYEILYTYIRNISFIENASFDNLQESSGASHKNYLLKNAQ